MAISEEVDARKETIKEEGALELVAGAENVYVASGKKTLTFVPAEADRDELLKRITGRTGNLRAPALRKGKVFYVGFNEEMYSGLS